MDRLENISFMLSALIASCLCEYCSDSDTTYNLFDSYSNYKTKYCPFGCCGTSSHQHCCYNAGINAAVIVVVAVCIVAVVTIISCCCCHGSRVILKWTRERPQTCGPTPEKTCRPTPAKTCRPTPGVKLQKIHTMNPNAPPLTTASVSLSNNDKQTSRGINQGVFLAPGDSTLPRKQDNSFEYSSYSSPVSYEIYDVTTLRQVVSLY